MKGRDNFSRVGIDANPQLRPPSAGAIAKLTPDCNYVRYWHFEKHHLLCCESHNPISNTIDLTVGEVASMSMGYLPLASTVGVWGTILWRSAFTCQL
jgi:hypothetical protein